MAAGYATTLATDDESPARISPDLLLEWRYGRYVADRHAGAPRHIGTVPDRPAAGDAFVFGTEAALVPGLACRFRR